MLYNRLTFGPFLKRLDRYAHGAPDAKAIAFPLSLIALILAYIVLGAADLMLMLRYSRRGLDHADAEAAEPSDAPGTVAPALTY